MGIAITQIYKQTRAWAWARESWISKLWRDSRNCRREIWAWARGGGVIATHPNVAQMAESLAALDALASGVVNEGKSTEAPIFLLSTGMRSGSTLFQRILVTDPRILLWGEPLAEMTVVSTIAEMLARPLSPWVPDLWRQHVDLSSSSLATSWIADLYPPPDDFLLAIRTFFERWLSEPARRSGFARWGFKEVRLTAGDAVLLHWLYPRAKFVTLSRHPYDVYKSMVGWPHRVWYRTPDIPFDDAVTFARDWNQRALSWSQLPTGFPCFHIKYEDLIESRVDFRKLETWLGLEIKENVALSVTVGSAQQWRESNTPTRQRLSWYERLIIAREAAAGMRALGYSK
jgi:sulfotransferase family protein